MRKTDREERPREIVEVVGAGGEDRLAWGKSSSLARPISDSKANGEEQRAVQALHGTCKNAEEGCEDCDGRDCGPAITHSGTAQGQVLLVQWNTLTPLCD